MARRPSSWRSFNIWQWHMTQQPRMPRSQWCVDSLLRYEQHCVYAYARCLLNITHCCSCQFSFSSAAVTSCSLSSQAAPSLHRATHLVDRDLITAPHLTRRRRQSLQGHSGTSSMCS